MQCLARQEEFFLQGRSPAGFDELQVAAVIAAVKFVADDGKAEMMKVNADLMHAAGFGLRLDQSERHAVTFEAPQRAERGAAGRSLRMDDLFDPDVGFLHLYGAENGGIESFLIPFGPAVNERGVGLVDFAFLHRHAEEAGEFVIFRDEYDATGLAIEAVDEGDLAAVGDFIREEITEPMPERGRAVGSARMDLQRRGFIDDDVAICLVDDSEGSVIANAHGSEMASCRA